MIFLTMLCRSHDHVVMEHVPVDMLERLEWKVSDKCMSCTITCLSHSLISIQSATLAIVPPQE